MIVKDIARQVIDTLPDQASMEDIIQALYIRTKFDRGLHEISDGKGITQEEAERQLEKWLL